ncbi:MAG: hypothetical protein ACI38Q_02820 [Candidatus Bruticola sp.]
MFNINKIFRKYETESLTLKQVEDYICEHGKNFGTEIAILLDSDIFSGKITPIIAAEGIESGVDIQSMILKKYPILNPDYSNIHLVTSGRIMTHEHPREKWIELSSADVISAVKMKLSEIRGGGLNAVISFKPDYTKLSSSNVKDIMKAMQDCMEEQIPHLFKECKEKRLALASGSIRTEDIAHEASQMAHIAFLKQYGTVYVTPR